MHTTTQHRAARNYKCPNLNDKLPKKEWIKNNNKSKGVTEIPTEQKDAN